MASSLYLGHFGRCSPEEAGGESEFWFWEACRSGLARCRSGLKGSVAFLATQGTAPGELGGEGTGQGHGSASPRSPATSWKSRNHFSKR